MRDDLRLRNIFQDDFEQWLGLWNQYNEFYGRSGANALSGEITKTTWSRFFDPNEPLHALVADSGGELVGIVGYLFHRSTISVASVCYLQDLFTLESARGRGIATGLIGRVTDHARREGCARVYWQTHESNAGARRLYERIAERSGFIVYRKSL